MKSPISMSICAAVLLGAAEASAEQQEKSPEQAANAAPPKSIACAQETGEALGQCSYSVKRDETGETTITVAFANGFKRRLFFKDGTFLKANATMSGTGTDIEWSLKDGTHMIRVDDQRYEVPGALIVSN